MSLVIYEEGKIDDDLLIAQWWAEMRQAGELELVFSSPPSLGKLYKGLASPTVCLLDFDEQGVWFVAWFEPIFSGALFSVWVAERKRHSKGALENFKAVATSGVKDYGTLIGVTKQAKLLDEHERLGYSIVAEVPGFYGGEMAWIMILNQGGLDAVARPKRERKSA